ncbi:NAD(P)H-binding protein [Enterococcus sp. AZ091]|uniref:NAD(P)H-binding protein n=1 Tax=Enterococcus sp. AZ091 TaxID=2774720 RepID=UPI003F68F754
MRKQLLARDETLVLYVPKKNQTTLLDPQRESMFQGDLLDLGRILRGMIGCEIVCLCEMPEPQVTWRIIEAMKLLDLTRIVCLVKPEESFLSDQIPETKTTHKKARSSQMTLSIRMIEEAMCDYTILHLPAFLHECSPESDLETSKDNQLREVELQVADLLAQISEQPTFLAKRTLSISNHLL